MGNRLYIEVNRGKQRGGRETEGRDETDGKEGNSW